MIFNIINIKKHVIKIIEIFQQNISALKYVIKFEEYTS